MSKKSSFYKILEIGRQLKYDKINAKFASNDEPSGKALMTTGCMERFVDGVDAFVDPVKSIKLEQGSSKEEYLEKDRLSTITPDMDLGDIMKVLNPGTEQWWDSRLY